MKKRKYYCGNCYYFLIDPNILNREVGECYYQSKTPKADKDKACKCYRPRPHIND